MNYDGGLQLEMDWIKCPICGGKTHNKKRRYRNEEISPVLPEMQAGNTDRCEEFNCDRSQRFF